MKRSAVLLARAIGYIEAYDLIPLGQVSFPDMVREIAQQYQFQKFPQTLEEHDLTKGVEFLQGKSGKKTILKLVIWDSIIVVDTRSNTEESKSVLDEILSWGSHKFGLRYTSGTIKHFAYISDVTFYSDVPILSGSAPVTNLAARISHELSEIWQESLQYESMSMKIGHDPLTRKNGIAPFLIERRAETRFVDEKYFSEAPLPTDLHWKLLEQFESEIVTLGRVPNVSANHPS